jgi:diguanylate cyclase (GGDEF)-like protein
LRNRYDQEAQQRQLDKLRQDNHLIGLQLENRIANQRGWLGGAVILLLAMILLALLYRRVRVLNERLADNQEFLRGQSERDPLTGLFNRRRLTELTVLGGLDQVFEGVLVLVDIDHFKRVNDQHGHAAGDQVLVELSRRLSAVVRWQDLVLRWGGEEFLVYMPAAGVQQAHELAARILEVFGGTPVGLPTGTALRVTASIGYGAIPLPPLHLQMSLERAINLADMALYTAKREGRNRAIGLESLDARDASDLKRIERDFDQALQEGRVSLRRMAGPATPLSVVASGASATAA